MESTVCRTVTTLGFQPTLRLVVSNKSVISENENYQKFLKELRSYSCGYWKWLRRRIRVVFVVGSLIHPENGKIEKIRIKRKTTEFLELADGRRFDVKTGRSFSQEPLYVFPLGNGIVRDSWEVQSLRQRLERALVPLPFRAVRAYADLLHPNWHLGGLLNCSFNGAADAISEREAASMAWCREFTKSAISKHLPTGIHDFRALVQMMEGDAKC
jgi:hypothetical protein